MRKLERSFRKTQPSKRGMQEPIGRATRPHKIVCASPQPFDNAKNK
jgi:hypothetical protein